MDMTNLNKLFDGSVECEEPPFGGEVPAAAPALNQDELLALLEQEREKNKRLHAIVDSQAHRAQSLTLKVSEKGAVSVYGMGRFPLTAYPDQWLKIFAIADQMKAFIRENKAKLSFKSQS